MITTGIPTVSRAATGYTCEEPFGPWGHNMQIKQGDLYVRLAIPPGEHPDPCVEGWSSVRCCLECARELPRSQYQDVCWQVTGRWAARIFGLPLHMVGHTPRQKDFVLPTQTLLRMAEPGY